MKRIRVLIIEDSQVIREFLQYIIARDPRLEVAAAVDSAEEALRVFAESAPDVVSMDIRLPGMNGFEATRCIMSENPTPIVVVSASVESEDLKITMNALLAGALAVVEKPVGTTHADYEILAHRLCTQLAIMSQVKVVRQRLNGKSSPALNPTNTKPAETVLSAHPENFQILGIVASTGGPNALVPLLNGLGLGFPLPILLVQHITASFLEGFVSWLDSVCQFSVRIAKDGELPAPGRVYLAPADRHLRLESGCLRVDAGDPVCAQRPSGTVLFQSMARSSGCRSVGVLLTGMGDDGAQGLLELRKAGCYTIAEHESTAVVYGMPGAGAKLGAVCESLPLPAIAPRILQLASARKGAC
ncbi:MAG TPA: chemotaxis-specific protein-glutamate methyltransferase CheB [Bryobacteraceae bacterium]|nr:chemotaxis-specific protein-glutamate methyltransferase CheB [Bryobacteraceae bacterium]